jgi:hypothetical protein
MNTDDLRAQLKAAGFSDEEIEQHLKGASTTPAPVTAPRQDRPAAAPATPSRRPGLTQADYAQAFGSGAIPGFEMAASAMGGLASALQGKGFKEGYRQTYAGMAESEKLARRRGDGMMTAANIAGSLATAPLMPAKAVATLGGRALTFGGMEAVRQAGRAGMEEGEAPSASDMARGAVVGGAAGAAGVPIGEKVLVPAIRGVGRLGSRLTLGAGGAAARAIGTGMTATRRAVADVLEAPAVQRALGGGGSALARGTARMIEPMDLQAIQRTMREQLRPTGETVEEVVNPMLRQAQAAAERAAGRQGGMEVNQARQVAQQALDAAKAEAGTAVPGVGVTGADALRASIRKQQVEAGKKSYQLVRDLGVEPDVNVVFDPLQSALRNPILKRAYNAAVNRPNASVQSVVIGEGKRQREFLVPDLEGLDLMRQAVRDRQGALLAGNKTGITRTQAKAALDEIDNLEKSYLEALPAEAGDALRAARAEYREYFEQLRGLQRGLNLGRYGVGRDAGLLTGSSKDLAALERVLADEGLTSPAAREAFKIGAAEWVNTVIQRSPNDAAKVAKAFVGTEEARRRARLALGDEAVANMEAALSRVQEAGRAVTAAGRATVAGPRAAGRTDIQRVREFERQLKAGQRAVIGGDVQQAAGFAQGVAPAMSPFALRQTRDVAASALDRELAGKTPEQALVLLRGLRENPAAKLLFGSDIETAYQRLMRGSEAAQMARGLFGARMAGRYAGGSD